MLSGYLSMLQDGTIGPLPDSAEMVLGEMRRKTQSIARIVEDMLEDARHQDGGLHLARRPVDLREVVEAAVGDSRRELPPTHSLRCRLPDDPVRVLADPGRVQTILRNLLDNAVKYSPDGGHIECRLDLCGGEAVLTVADEGIGIPEDEQRNLFARFSRGSLGASTAGVGLGLYLARTLARMHGGDIELYSRPGAGSEFRVRLPLA